MRGRTNRHSITAGEKEAGTNRDGLRGTSSVMVRVVQKRNARRCDLSLA
jgi:hypothetical protein